MDIEKYIAYNTGSLVISSTFFLVPCIYTIYNSMHFFTVLLILTSGISANYWRKAIYGAGNLRTSFANPCDPSLNYDTLLRNI